MKLIEVASKSGELKPIKNFNDLELFVTEKNEIGFLADNNVVWLTANEIFCSSFGAHKHIPARRFVGTITLSQT